MQMFRSFEEIDSTKETEIILISDGANGRGSMETAMANLTTAGVVVHSIAVTGAADQRLVDISKETGGRCFAYTDKGSTSLATILNEIISGRSSTSSAVTTVCLNYKEPIRNIKNDSSLISCHPLQPLYG